MGKRKSKKDLEELNLYKKIRKRIPPPTRVTPDKREKIKEKINRKEIEEESGEV